MKMRETWERTVHLTIEEILMDDSSSEFHYTCEVSVQVYKERPEPENYYPGGVYVGEYTIDKYTQYKDGVQGLTYTAEQARVEFPAHLLVKIDDAVNLYITSHENSISQQAADDEQGAYEYAQEQRFQAMRDND